MLAHANAQTIRYSLKNNTITYFNESDVDWSSAIDYQCPDCLIGKKHQTQTYQRFTTKIPKFIRTLSIPTY
ncbi:hypothetical protein WN66_07058 [Saccharomyces cerevisiae]|nr:hypothetical protein WN66_07058 [Saccharomyces cerevisiae]